MEIQTTKMSSKGQIVLPRKVRENVDAGEGTLFTIISHKDVIILKKIKTLSKEQLVKDLEGIAKEGKKRAEKLGIKESDIQNLVHTIRKERK